MIYKIRPPVWLVFNTDQKFAQFATSIFVEIDSICQIKAIQVYTKNDVRLVCGTLRTGL